MVCSSFLRPPTKDGQRLYRRLLTKVGPLTMSGFPKRISLIFPVISVAAIYLVSNLFLNSGHARLFEGLQHGRPYMFADGVTTLRTFYTGLSSLDNYLANLQLIFANVIDGSSLHLALLGLQFGSVIFAVFTVMLTEALLAGRRQDLAMWAWSNITIIVVADTIG